MDITPREYQLIAVTAVLAALRSACRALMVMATGFGKTLTAAIIAKKFRAKKILFLVHNNFILKHAMDEFRKVFGDEVLMALYNGMSKNGAEDAQIVFATWQTMGKNLKKWKRNHFDLIIVDEAHHSEANTYRPVTDYFTGPKLGITATPDRTDEADIRDVFGPEVVNITLEEAIARKWLPRIEYHVVTDESLDEDALQKIAAEIREGKKRFTMAEVNRRIFIKKRDKEIAKIINGYNEKAVVFCANIPHAERMAKSLTLGKSFHSQKGKSQKDTWQKNKDVLDALRNGTVRRVTAVNAFNEGVDVTSVGLVGFCRVTGSEIIFRQQLGRGLRPGKDKLIVLDFVGNLERIQMVLEMVKEIERLHEKFISEEEREREGYTREKFEVSGKGFEFTFSDQIVDLMEVLEHCEREFYPTWQEAAEAAEKLGIYSVQHYLRIYRRDPRLPADPNSKYKDFPGWLNFLGKSKKEDPRLPGTPNNKYSDFPGWIEFLGTTKYATWQEAATSARKLKITSYSDYKKRRKSDVKLPGDPARTYRDFPGWVEFLGKEK